MSNRLKDVWEKRERDKSAARIREHYENSQNGDTFGQKESEGSRSHRRSLEQLRNS